MSKDFPIWVSVLRAALQPIAELGRRAEDLRVRLQDKHCLCGMCKDRGKGGYAKEPIVKHWVCGCITLFYKSHGTKQQPNLGFLIWKCGQCRTAAPIINEILEEERQEKGGNS